MYNEITVIGYVAREPDVTITSTNAKVAKINIGSSVNSKHVKYTIWFTVSVWSAAADFAEKYLHTGDLVHVTGSLVPDYETGNPPVFKKLNGEYGSKYEVRGRVLTLLHRKHSEEARDDDDYFGEKGADDILF